MSWATTKLHFAVPESALSASTTEDTQFRVSSSAPLGDSGLPGRLSQSTEDEQMFWDHELIRGRNSNETERPRRDTERDVQGKRTERERKAGGLSAEEKHTKEMSGGRERRRK